MIELLKQILNNKKISFYKIISKHEFQKQFYFVHDKLETARTIDSTNYEITIYVIHDDKLGEASFNISCSYDKEDIISKVDEAILNAYEINNDLFKLEENIKSIDEIDSNFKDYDLTEVLTLVKDTCFSSISDKNTSINALEAFVSKTEREIYTSTNIFRKEVFYNCFLEAIPTYTKDKESVEIYKAFNFSNLNLDTLKEKIISSLEEVKYRFYAKKPDFEINMPVALRGLEQKELFLNIVSELNYSNVYNKSNIYKINDKLQNDISNLNISMVNNINGGACNHIFDDYGSSLISTKLIENGIVKNYFGGIRYSTYLNLKNTGELENISVSEGNISNIDFDYIELVSLSGLQVDLYSDYVGGEIRLAYIHKDGDIIPVTGISFQVSLKKLLNTLKLTKEKEVSDFYDGPKLIFFDGAKII